VALMQESLPQIRAAGKLGTALCHPRFPQ
jgi:hypothetical protein